MIIYYKCDFFLQAIMMHNYLSQGGYVLVRLLVCWVVCQQDYTKTIERLSMKLGWRVDLSPEQTPLTCGADPIKWTDPAITLTLSDKLFALCGSRWSKCGSSVSQLMQVEMHLNQADHFIWEWTRLDRIKGDSTVRHSSSHIAECPIRLSGPLSRLLNLFWEFLHTHTSRLESCGGDKWPSALTDSSYRLLGIHLASSLCIPCCSRPWLLILGGGSTNLFLLESVLPLSYLVISVHLSVARSVHV